MEKKYKNNTNKYYLAQWLNKEITDSELKSFIKDEDFNIYVKIKERLDYFEAPLFEKDNLKENIDKKILNKDIKVKKMTYSWVYAVAAMLAVIFSVYFYNSTKAIQYATKTGETLSIELLDGSNVVINSESVVSFSKKEWKKERSLKLTGEAFFKVKKGKKFTVKTDNGTVSVLGTEFNINSQNNFFNVKCYSGKVSVIHNTDTIFLTKGKAYQFNGSKTETWDFIAAKPAWFNNESTFKSTPLKIVIKSLENHFGIDIKSDNIGENQIFTGSYSYDDLDVALKSVFYPMGIRYRIDNKIVFLSKK